MKIELSEYTTLKPYKPLIVKEIRKNSEREYSIIFGEYELLIRLNKNSDIEKLKRIFNKEFSLESWNSEISFLVKKNDKSFLEGKYEDSEFIEEEGHYKGTLEFHIVDNSSGRSKFKIYIIPEDNENMSMIFDKIFK